ncbi:MAG: class I adenylate-forming enzyme family protein [Acidimicrobiia bacterium]
MDVRIHDILTRAARLAPTQLAATLGDDQRTLAELSSGSNRAAHRLAGEGVAPLDRVVWWGPTDLAALELCYGVTKLGAALAPINPGFTETEATSAIEYLRPRIVVAHPTYEDLARSIAGPLGLDVVTTTVDWLQGAATTPLPRVGNTEDACAIFLTSGSTGAPKAALLSHRASWLRAVAREAEDGSPGRNGEVVMFGLFHMAGWYFLEHAWAVDRPVHLVHRADAHELLAAVERRRASTLYGIPAVWQRILDDGARYDASSLREVLTGTSRVDLGLVDALKARFPGSWTSVAYGSTEIGRGAVLADADLYAKPSSVGLPPPAVEAQIDDESELLLRGPTMFSGYLDRPDATAVAIDADGWFHTGDLATQDADGYLTITGRSSEGIRSGGEWIAPVEVEAAILTHPAVAEVGVVGLPDDRWGELVYAAIVLRPGAMAPTVEELRAHLASRLASHKHPRVIVAVGELPHTAATGQIRRAALRDRLIGRER